MNNDSMLKSLIEVFQLYIEYNEKNFIKHYDNLNINEIHAISYIGRTEMANVTKITKHLKITKGAVTKITKKLIKNDFLSLYQIEGNRKEKYFNLTDKGEAIFKKHEILHHEAFQRDKKMFNQFNDADKKVISEFIEVLKSDLSNKLNN